MTETLRTLRFELESLTVYRELLKEEPIKCFKTLVEELCDNMPNGYSCVDTYARTYYELRRAGFDSLGGFIAAWLKTAENPFTWAAAMDAGDEDLLEAGKRDLNILTRAAMLSCREIKAALLAVLDGKGDVSTLPRWGRGSMPGFESLCRYYRENGVGIFAGCRAFSLTPEGLIAIEHHDPINSDVMIGYEWQRQEVYDNTKALVEGGHVNNVLLYGDSGTGKSATVKSMLNMEEFDKLRIVEIDKSCINEIPTLLRRLRRYPQKFILFIDDLSFEEGDKNYSAFKVIMEGSLEQRPANTALYVTSNRRQLVKRRFSDMDEIDGTETVQEKTSLSDRFGVRIPYLALGRQEYLDMSEALCRQRGCEQDSELIRREALRWEMEHASRTPRTATQFADFMAAK
ncbi:MAG: DUF815 domain-containing protein [Oscillospiraceae bacterium]|nr:DUF815 domain-containing protein [Oscillospiraceae bacterium]